MSPNGWSVQAPIMHDSGFWAVRNTGEHPHMGPFATIEHATAWIAKQATPDNGPEQGAMRMDASPMDKTAATLF